MRITLRQYYGEFASLLGLVVGIPFVAPLLHLFFPDSSMVADYLYPPLGDVEWIAVAATIGFMFAATFVVFTYCQSAQKIHSSVSAILMSLAALSVCALIILHVRYIRHIPVSSSNLEIPVSIGYQRTDFANQNYPEPQFNDWEMLRRAGPIEEKIQQLWTPHSIWVVRILLWLCCTLTLVCFVALMCLAVYQHAVEETANAAKLNTPTLPQA